MKVIILCGGLGTRLKSIVKDVPKPMALINGKPFLEFIFEYLITQNIKEVILAVSYKYEIIKNHFKNKFLDIKIEYSIEKEPLGTGGAIKQALNLVNENSLVLNGDTFFNIDLSYLNLQESKICLALKSMQDFDRYGAVELDKNYFINSFREKQFFKQGFINGGIYLVSKDIFNTYNLENKFSFESFLQENFKTLKARACIFDNYFIDIGVPEDYERFLDDSKSSKFKY
ncbi:D-glycero-D-manno-heptose 1-phosphate guanosyltransferase [Campylobacter sp. TTU_617]|uniref:D-glycero-D-manno-heptose 1-phosphate guanosyltransferase n=1 Tax=Campylobacter sp. TTU_617 TaxID=2768148 RepID=UPI00190672B9|nr:nucleotidyltransferase family protein [Campylobacter sp. TTU_617]MBK1972276.1 nucleotidyltransferase family protein [Campylobacter sp. TTU_617]